MGNWEEKSANKVNFGITGDKESRHLAVGETLEGRLVTCDPTQLKVNNYTLDTGEELVTFLGTAALDKLISTEVGSLVRITYKGDQKSGSGFSVKQFNVQVYRESAEEAEETGVGELPEILEPEPESKAAKEK